MNWEKNLSSVINGYKLDEKTKTLPVFINYQKTADAVAYDDRFTSERSIIALSKHPRRVDSDDADHIYKRGEENKDNQIYLFVRKNKDDNEAKKFLPRREDTANLKTAGNFQAERLRQAKRLRKRL